MIFPILSFVTLFYRFVILCDDDGGMYSQNNFDELVYWSEADEPEVCEIDDDYTNHYGDYAHKDEETVVYDRSLRNSDGSSGGEDENYDYYNYR